MLPSAGDHVPTVLPAADCRIISEDQSHDLWLGVLARQGLAGGAKPETADAAADLSLGLHAARLSSPFVTLLARLSQPAAAEVIFVNHQPRPVLVTVRCMRKTLHMLPGQMAQIAHIATRHFRERDALRLAHNAGLSGNDVRVLVAELEQIVADHGPIGHREIESKITRERWPVAALRAGLKVAWETGRLTYVNATQHWNREIRTFTLADDRAPGILKSADRERAANALVVAYFERYGPASVRDVVWWSGLSQRAVLAALRLSDRHVLALTAPWCEEALYMFGEIPRRGAAVDSEPGVVDFLAHEDVALKAYFSTRRRYLGMIPPRYAFNQIGEVLPTILLDGRVAGLWQWNRRDRRVTFELVKPDRAAVRRCNERAEALTLSLRRRHDGT